LVQLGATLLANGLGRENAFVLTNPQVAALYFSTVERSLAEVGFQRIVRYDIPATEEGKNWDVFSETCAALLRHFPDAGASPLVVLLGGGVVGDLGGFAAAVYRRGVPFVQVPTTLLAAVDSSVGGKVAVNFGGVKNIMGAFSQPRMALCDLETLSTLSPRESRSGTAEVIKYGAVCCGALFADLEAGLLEKVLALDPTSLVDVVTRCVRLKAAVVERDELDKLGIRNVLNFGHTIGHALELSADYALTHGEAISIGMVAATELAVRLGVCDTSYQARISELLLRAGLPIAYHGHGELFDPMARALQLDKKFQRGKNVFVLPTGPGAWQQVEDIPWPMIHEVMRAVIE
ncbi:MAG: 3-dehydroquinate synthase, partial [Verrucomicrobiota bacterium]